MYDRKAKGRVNVIGAMLKTYLLTISLFTCNIDSNVFQAWLTQDLLPKLPNNSVIVMDNATFHKRKDIQTCLTEAGHTLEYLPPYSPDLNPIEHKWTQAKAVRKRTNVRVEDLFTQEEI